MGFWGQAFGGKGLETAEKRSWASYDNLRCEVSTGNRDLGEFSSTKADTPSGRICTKVDTLTQNPCTKVDTHTSSKNK